MEKTDSSNLAVTASNIGSSHTWRCDKCGGAFAHRLLTKSSVKDDSCPESHLKRKLRFCDSCAKTEIENLCVFLQKTLPVVTETV